MRLGPPWAGRGLRTVVLALGLATGSAAWAEAPSLMAASLYNHPGRRVAVQGRRRLNLVCVGRGSPVVVLEAGLGDSALTWASVHKGIAAFTTTCAYDRAGYGFSDPPARPSNAANAADDLQRLLAAARLRRPIVLVAHSLGGLYATLYASRHRREVAGMVLVDPSFAEQNREIFQLSTPAQRAASDARLRGFIALGRHCLALAAKGWLSANSDDPPGCLPSAPDPALSAINRRAYTRAQTQAAKLSEIQSISSFEDSKDSADSRAIDATRHDLGAMPLIVLTRGNPTPPPAFLDAETQARVDAAWKQGHDRLAASSSAGQSRVVPDSDHYIQHDQPAAVIQAVREVVLAVRAPRGSQQADAP